MTVRTFLRLPMHQAIRSTHHLLPSMRYLEGETMSAASFPPWRKVTIRG